MVLVFSVLMFCRICCCELLFSVIIDIIEVMLMMMLSMVRKVCNWCVFIVSSVIWNVLVKWLCVVC